MTEQYEEVDFGVFMQRYEEAQQRPTGGGGFDYWRPKAAALGKPPLRNVVRLLPPHKNMKGDPIIGTKVHFSLGPNQDTASPCLEPFGEECPACAWVDHLFAQAKSEPDAETAKTRRDLAFRIRAKYRFFANVVDMAKPEAGVQVWAFGPELEKRVRGCFLDDNQPPQPRNITHPEHGRDVIIEATTKPGRKQGETFPDYETIRAKDTPSPLADMSWLSQLRDLTEEVYRPTADDVKAALQGKKITRSKAPALPAAQTVVPTGTALPEGARNITPPPAAPAPAARGRRAAGAPAPVPGATTAAAPAAPSAPAPAPAAPAMPGKMPGKSPVAPAPTADDGWTAAMAQGAAEVTRLGGFTPTITPRPELEAMGKPSCYGRDTDPADVTCKECPGLVSCMAIKLGIWAA